MSLASGTSATTKLTRCGFHSNSISPLAHSTGRSTNPLTVASSSISSSLSNGTISTTIHEKELNLHLYLPPDSCHPPGVLKGLIFGAFHRILRLTTQRQAQIDFLQKLFWSLRRRGYNHSTISKLFASAYNHYRSHPPSIVPDPDKASLPGDTVLLHLPYHPRDPLSCFIQHKFQQLLSDPAHDHPLADFVNHRYVPLGIPRLIIAYH